MELLFIWLLFGIFSAILASNKGRSGCGWFIVGILFGPFGLLVGLMSPVGKESPGVYSQPATSETGEFPCPSCGKTLYRGVYKCPWCGTGIE